MRRERAALLRLAARVPSARTFPWAVAESAELLVADQVQQTVVQAQRRQPSRRAFTDCFHSLAELHQQAERVPSQDHLLAQRRLLRRPRSQRIRQRHTRLCQPLLDRVEEAQAVRPHLLPTSLGSENLVEQEPLRLELLAV
jgi:hypothetical protein